jgi:tetratricopeptide (TPR) repeat protein
LTTALIVLLPAAARFYNNRGTNLQRQGQIKAAIDNYQRALRLKSDYPEAHYNLADAFEEISIFDKAIEEYGRAIEADPTFYQAYNNLARLYILQRRDYEAAIRLLDRAMNLKPQESSVQYSLYKNYGWANFELNHLPLAEQSLRTAVSFESDRGAAHCLLAKALSLQRAGGNPMTEWELCGAYSTQAEVEPEWRVEAQEQLHKGSR